MEQLLSLFDLISFEGWGGMKQNGKGVVTVIQHYLLVGVGREEGREGERMKKEL